MSEAVWVVLQSELEARQKQAAEHPDCAWCLRDADQEMGTGSHGICEQHAEEQYQEWRSSHGKRGAA